ncbi:hypothetical protein Phum_PHUM482700 [Pediculus humanus corporis]|uniref:Uncharacterized protein n=1 Tax=Pediculus humanus subsp. corporis TaxID=121224 RepID=E0VWD4_PEDHC|nr:uncharacterized protein Phum_PHUM482700 [Pediculus humanus corporis]EEB17719.1 hypothetical protein Phum_PHUM482700 [Pediculus humanus corporis]
MVNAKMMGYEKDLISGKTIGKNPKFNATTEKELYEYSYIILSKFSKIVVK